MRLPRFGRSRGRKAVAVDLVGIGSCLVITLASYFAVVGPAVARRTAAAVARRGVAVSKQRLATATATIRAADADLRGVRATVAAKSVRLVPEDRLNQQLAAVASLAAEAGLAVEDVRPGAVLGGPRFGVVPVRISGRGRFPDCVRFVHRLRSQNPDMGLADLRLTATDDGRDAAFEFTLRWYTAAAAAPPAVADVPPQ